MPAVATPAMLAVMDSGSMTNLWYIEARTEDEESLRKSRHQSIDTLAGTMSEAAWRRRSSASLAEYENCV
jgi:hypothetical protein